MIASQRSTATKLLFVLLVGLVAVLMVTNAAIADRPNPPPSENCSDGIDNDGDGLIDSDDPDCDAPPPPPPECSDHRDNDFDNAVDAFDRDCTGPDDNTESGSAEPECSDGIDNDGDRLIDWAEDGDPDCESDDDPSEGVPPPPAACNDGEDNDGDGLVDGDDPGCDGPEDNDETDPTTPPACADGIDNDGDGLIDGDDPGCDGPDDTDETDPVVEPTCGDPDGDGIDHSSFDPAADETGPLSSVVHGVDQALPFPLGADGGVVTEVNCALVAGALGL